MGGDHHNKDGPLILIIAYFFLAIYLAAYVHVILHELAHFFAIRYFGATPDRVVLGGREAKNCLIHFKLKGTTFSIGPDPRKGHCHFDILPHNTNEQVAYIFVAGPIVTVFFCFVASWVAITHLPLLPCFGIVGFCLECLIRLLHGARLPGCDLYEFQQYAK